MIHEEDLKRQEDPKVRRLKLLAKACANAQLDSFKNLWYNKLTVSYTHLTLPTKA